jgi:hypothetical protein
MYQSFSVCTASQCLSSRDTRIAAEKRPAEAAPYAQADERHYRDRKRDRDSNRDRDSKRYCSRWVMYLPHDVC